MGIDYDYVRLPSDTQNTGPKIRSATRTVGPDSDSVHEHYFHIVPDDIFDAFARLRVSNPVTIFDSKQLNDNGPLFWDDAETSGGGTGSAHDVNNATSTLSVTATTAGVRVRQTKMRFNYQPGKSQLIIMTGLMSKVSSGITKRIGLFDANNGLGFYMTGGNVGIFRRTYVTGSAVTNVVVQGSWNLDTLDGSGRSGLVVNFNLPQIYFLDFEWLGLGRVRFGVFVDGVPYYCHELLNANNLSTVYMSHPNLPLRFELTNDGTGAAASLTHICTTVISEGGSRNLGVVRYDSTSTAVNAATAGTIYAVVGIKQKATYLNSTVLIEDMSMLASSLSDNFEWLLYLNPTVAGTFTYGDVANSAVQTAKGAVANTVTNGTLIAGGFGASGAAVSNKIESVLSLGSTIAGTPDAFVLCVRGITNNINIYGGLTWRELV